MTLDATGFTERGAKLVKKIEDEVRATQLYIIRELPNELLVTKDQFDNLMSLKNGVSYMAAVNDAPDHMTIGSVQKAYMFYTPINVMDVKITGRPELDAV